MAQARPFRDCGVEIEPVRLEEFTAEELEMVQQAILVGRLKDLVVTNSKLWYNDDQNEKKYNDLLDAIETLLEFEEDLTT